MSKAQEVALWAALGAFFGSILAIGAFDVFDIEGWAELLMGVIAAGFAAGGVYAQQRLDFAKKRENG